MGCGASKEMAQPEMTEQPTTITTQPLKAPTEDTPAPAPEKTTPPVQNHEEVEVKLSDRAASKASLSPKSKSTNSLGPKKNLGGSQASLKV